MALSSRVTRRERRGPPGDPEPRLRLDLGHKLKVLALANAIPLMVIGWLIWGISQGSLELRAGTRLGKLALVLTVVLMSLAMVGFSAWILLPLGRWLHAYPAWRMRHGNALCWVLPWLGGGLTYLLMWLIMAVIGLLALFVIGEALIGLWQHAQELPPG